MKERKGLNSKNEKVSQKVIRPNKALEKSHFWVRVRAFYVWGEKKRKRSKEEKEKEGRRKKKKRRKAKVWNFV